jgi:Flp pilus assembly pilin Flp
MNLFKRLWKEESALTTVEYALLGVFLVIALATAVTALKKSISDSWTKTGTKINETPP